MMVTNIKSKILNLLKQENNVSSGEAISKKVGVSRVSVWKHIRRLKDLGYEIISSGSGYHLIKSPDTPFTWEFPEREDKIIYYDELESTMETAKQIAGKGAPHFTVVIAGRQTKGRGRLKRTWISQDGGLYFTIILRPYLPPFQSGKVNFMASVSLVRVLRAMYKIDAKVKWPNDILVNGKKITGMLSEMEADSDLISFVNVGIGVNVNNDPSREEPNATSIAKLLGKSVSRKELLAAFLDDFERRMEKADYGKITDDWKKSTMTLGKNVRIITIKDQYEGKAIDIDEDGALIIELKDKTRKKIIYGDCFFN